MARHSRTSGNPPNMGLRFRGDDAVFAVDGKPVMPIPAFDRVENLALRRIRGVGVPHWHAIHLNPLRAGLARRAQDWPWSGDHDYQGSVNCAPTTPSGLFVDRVLLPADAHTRIEKSRRGSQITATSALPAAT